MAMSKSSYQYNRVTWEDAEFPILCQTCLGDNPYLRMMKEKFGRECKICQRPFTTFRWCPGRGMRYKKTEVCQTCAKLKNVCQTCLLDLEYGLPVQVRDYALQLKDELPKSGANRDYYIQNAERELSEGDGTTPGGALAKLGEHGPNELLMKLARTQPYYHRNRPHICSFWVKGECKRGEECPYRHEKPTDPDDPLSEQNMKDRYYGVEDPVAAKLLNRAKAMPTLKPPDDRTISTLYVGNLGDQGQVSDSDLRNYFYQFGEVRSISLLSGKGCAFVAFTTRGAAEAASEAAFNKLILKGRRLTIRWGRPQAQHTLAPGDTAPKLDPVPGLPGADHQRAPPDHPLGPPPSATYIGARGRGAQTGSGAGFAPNQTGSRTGVLPPPPVDFFNLASSSTIPLPMNPPPGTSTPSLESTQQQSIPTSLEEEGGAAKKQRIEMPPAGTVPIAPPPMQMMRPPPPFVPQPPMIPGMRPPPRGPPMRFMLPGMPPFVNPNPPALAPPGGGPPLSVVRVPPRGPPPAPPRPPPVLVTGAIDQAPPAIHYPSQDPQHLGAKDLCD